jgi:hypothetical protein
LETGEFRLGELAGIARIMIASEALNVSGEFKILMNAFSLEG